MPYITKERREALQWDCEFPQTPGELNYVITCAVGGYLKAAGVNYHNINECIGVLECAKLELYRRIASPYEDTKIAENGDVYEYESLYRG